MTSISCSMQSIPLMERKKLQKIGQKLSDFLCFVCTNWYLMRKVQRYQKHWHTNSQYIWQFESHFFPLRQADWIEVYAIPEVWGWGWQPHYSNHKNWLTFLGTMTCVIDWLLWIIITWLQKTQPQYNNIECHRDVQKLLKTNFVDLFSLCLHLISPTLILPLVFLKCYIHIARKMTIHSSNSTRKPWEEEYSIGTQRYVSSVVWTRAAKILLSD